MLLGSSRNGRLEVTRFSVPTTSGTVSVIRRNAKRNTSGLTAPGSLNTYPMCEEQRWIFNVCPMLLWYTGLPSLGINTKDLAISDWKLAEGFMHVWYSQDLISKQPGWQLKLLPTALLCHPFIVCYCIIDERSLLFIHIWIFVEIQLQMSQSTIFVEKRKFSSH